MGGRSCFAQSTATWRSTSRRPSQGCSHVGRRLQLYATLLIDMADRRSAARVHASPGGAEPAGAVDGHDADGAAADRGRELDADSTVVCEPGAAGDHAALAADRDPGGADA